MIFIFLIVDIYLIFIGVWLICSIVLVSGVQHSDLVTYTWSISQDESFILTLPDLFSTVGTIPTVPAGERNAGNCTLTLKVEHLGP